MRLNASREVTVRKGYLVSIRCRLRPSMDLARLYIWSHTPGHDFAPHIQHSVMDVQTGDKPVWTAPMSTTLRAPLKREHTIEFFADEKLTFCVRQEADKKDEPLAKVQIRKYGPWALKLRALWRRLTGKDVSYGKTLSQG